MSSSSRRPVYIPNRGSSGRTRPPRFHGAFTGGYSAGFFNTVGSKEGWKPSEDARREQSVSDYMDEQDHDEWGGPTSVRAEFSSATPADQNPLSSWQCVPPPNVGKRLLRVLGWRDGGAAYVPADQQPFANETAASDVNQILSKKKLQKIQLQQTRVRLPAPKLDDCGLGFEPHKDAPEFRAHRERRKQQTQSKRSVYRISKVLGAGEDDVDQKEHPTEDSYTAYETIEDFVGQTSVGGFALRDDVDDTYDDEALTKVSARVRMDVDKYDTVAYEHNSDDEQETTRKTSKGHNEDDGADFGAALASWAGARPNSTAATGTVTADGRPPLPGFVLGTAEATQLRRFPGPDLPVNYVVRRHEFKDTEHPMVLKTLSRAEQLETIGKKRRAALEEALQSNSVQVRRTAASKTFMEPNTPMAGTTFSGLAVAMKNRFTSAKPNSDVIKPAPGLQTASASSSNTLAQPVAVAATCEAPSKLVRTTETFVPHPLLCKRFHVPPPKNLIRTHQSSEEGRFSEASYFQKEVLQPAQAVEGTAPKRKANGSRTTADAIEDEKVEPLPERPSMDTYKSIFQPDSEPSDEDEVPESGQLDHDHTSTKVEQAVGDNIAEHTAERRLVPYDEEKNTSRKQSRASDEDDRRRDRRRKRRSRSWSSSSSTTSSYERDRRRKKERKKDRRKRQEKKKRKKKSSKRKRREDR